MSISIVYFVRGIYSLLSTKMRYVKKIKKKHELKYIYFERGNTGKQTINAGNPESKFLKIGNRTKRAGLKGEKKIGN